MRTMMALALVLTMLTMVACNAGGSKDGGMPTEKPLVHGTITQKESDRYLIEEKPGQQSGDMKCWFAVTEKTAVYRQNGKLVDRAAVADLAVGQKVSAWADGPVRESYPCQTSAGTMLIFGP
ncbi:MAG TPA: DUF3221 domain-containing protein [Symbiobacteriaceae bacterium]|jgi:hypothetical protein|nr:DUF3221 domain-containing protein [Symbiobacteriaceae bacterium]